MTNILDDKEKQFAKKVLLNWIQILVFAVHST